MDNEMIERIISAMGGYWIAYGYDASEPDKGIVLAILEAMREPTEKMVLGADLYSSAEDSIGIYQAMIDAVIND